MGLLTLSESQAWNLRHFRCRTWALIALCFFARGVDAAFGLHLIEHAGPAASQAAPVCPTGKELLL
jgi:hypothetical protein